MTSTVVSFLESHASPKYNNNNKNSPLVCCSIFMMLFLKFYFFFYFWLHGTWMLREGFLLRQAGATL